MKVGKPKSKRVPVRLRHKIEKSSLAKQRKQRKDDKKNPQWKSRLKKDPGIPNLFPYKAQVLAEIEETKRRKEEEQMRRKELAKAQRQGRAVEQTVMTGGDEIEEDDEDLIDPEADDDEEMKDTGSNPMAALLASAQARAQLHTKDDDEEEDDEAEDDTEWGGIEEKTTTKEPARKVLPQKVIADPIKASEALMERMQKTPDGVQLLLEHYQIPPLVTGGSNMTTRFLVEVARKRGRLGRGGIPNMHAAALIVLNDINEDRLKLPAVQEQKKPAASGEVKIVQQMAQPFRIEGLWGGAGAGDATTEMAIDA